VKRYIVYVRKCKDITQEILINIANILTTSLLISYGIRRDTTVSIVIICKDYELTLIARGSSIKQLRADEESAVGFLKSVLKGKVRTIELLRGIKPEIQGTIYCIGSRGKMFEKVLSCNSISTLVLGDIEQLDVSNRCIWVSLYPKMYRDEDAVVMYHYILDKYCYNK